MPVVTEFLHIFHATLQHMSTGGGYGPRRMGETAYPYTAYLDGQSHVCRNASRKTYLHHQVDQLLLALKEPSVVSKHGDTSHLKPNGSHGDEAFQIAFVGDSTMLVGADGTTVSCMDMVAILSA